MQIRSFQRKSETIQIDLAKKDLAFAGRELPEEKYQCSINSIQNPKSNKAVFNC